MVPGDICQVKRQDVVELPASSVSEVTNRPKSSNSPPNTFPAKKNAAKCDATMAPKNCNASGFVAVAGG